MAIDKARRSTQCGDGRDAGGFVAIPWVILDSAAYIGLSHPAKSLLLVFASQHYYDKKERAYTNGRLLANAKTLVKFGWNSCDTLTRAKRELIEAGFLFETVKGRRPNKAGWYALTWFILPKRSNYDFGIQFKRFRLPSNVALIPTGRVVGLKTAPARGIEALYIAPPNGSTESNSGSISIPSYGNLSRVLPSTGDGGGGNDSLEAI